MHLFSVILFKILNFALIKFTPSQSILTYLRNNSCIPVWNWFISHSFSCSFSKNHNASSASNVTISMLISLDLFFPNLTARSLTKSFLNSLDSLHFIAQSIIPDAWYFKEPLIIEKMKILSSRLCHQVKCRENQQ